MPRLRNSWRGAYVLQLRELAGILSKQRPDMKILFSSGYTDDVILRHGIIERDIQFIEKPYTPQNLAVKIRTMLDG